MTQPFWVGTSWKMNKTLAEARAFAGGLPAQGDPRIQHFVIPPFTVLREVKAMLVGSDVLVGAQNMHWDDAGAWTGEISAPMLVDCGLDLVELGHSERRAHFAETDETVGLKVAAALRHGLIPLVCIGETLADREGGRADAVLAAEVQGALARIGADQRDAPILLAYEPVWAIGTGRTPTLQQIAEVHDFLRLSLRTHCGDEAGAEAFRLLYGGSVKPSNAAAIFAVANVDGALVGGASLKAADFGAIVAALDAAG